MMLMMTMIIAVMSVVTDTGIDMMMTETMMTTIMTIAMMTVVT